MRGNSGSFALVLLATMFVSVLVDLANCAEPAKAKPARKEVNPVMQSIQNDANLPRVLLIGDSISIGYTLRLRKLLDGKANVHRVLTNRGPTTKYDRKMTCFCHFKSEEAVAKPPTWVGISEPDAVLLGLLSTRPGIS